MFYVSLFSFLLAQIMDRMCIPRQRFNVFFKKIVMFLRF